MQNELKTDNANIEITTYPRGVKAMDFGFMFGIGFLGSIGVLSLLAKVAMYLFNLVF